ncbi:MAG: T9SS type A sorting domain-containing protein [Sphingobacteriales bacterium JAD_PAG50586_3]|nr:MAG: T9SS type A sorting domain-containing protein [Sphingobacteriales bacterium JAD_PAG50586_3]
MNICEIAEPISPRMQNQQQQVDTKIQKVTFYPNPAQNIGYFNVDNLLENETLDISIYSMEGALLFERHTDTGQSIITVDFTTFANGMYYYNIATNTNKAFRGKFFVIK